MVLTGFCPSGSDDAAHLPVARRTDAREDPERTAAALLHLLDAIEDLLGPRVLDYARRP